MGHRQQSTHQAEATNGETSLTFTCPAPGWLARRAGNEPLQLHWQHCPGPARRALTRLGSCAQQQHSPGHVLPPLPDQAALGNPCPESFLGSCSVSGRLEPTPPAHPCLGWHPRHGPGALLLLAAAPAPTQPQPGRKPHCPGPEQEILHCAQPEGRERAEEQQQNKTNRGKGYHVNVLKDPICSRCLN